MTLLTEIQGASSIIGLVKPTSVFGSSDQNTLTLLELAQVEGQELLERYSWQATTEEATHTTLNLEDQGVITTIAPGFAYIVNDTFWDQDLTEPVTGPLSPLEWQALKARTATGPYASFRIRGNDLLAYPAPPAGNTWVFEYQTTYFCQSSGGADQSAWAADDDVGILSEDIMKLGLVWRFKERAGLDYAENYRVYEQKVANATARDGGKRTMDMNGGGWRRRGLYVPEGSWT